METSTETKRMADEWEAWKSMCSELRAVGIEPNDQSSDKVIASIRLWGELAKRLSNPTPT